jgi:hypothetical protein
MKGNSKRPKGLLDITRMGRNVVVCSHQIDLGEETATRELMRVVMDVSDRIAVWNGMGVQRSIVSATLLLHWEISHHHEPVFFTST